MDGEVDRSMAVSAVDRRVTWAPRAIVLYFMPNGAVIGEEEPVSSSSGTVKLSTTALNTNEKFMWESKFSMLKRVMSTAAALQRAMSVRADVEATSIHINASATSGMGTDENTIFV